MRTTSGLVCALAFAGCGASIVENGDGGADAHVVLCDGGATACGGACVDLQRDPQNCGACGHSCANALCCSGVCVETAACSFAVTSIDPVGGWQNGGDFVTLHGAGFATGMKVFIGDGRAPVRVVDASNARIETPPGPLGMQPIKIALGNQAATTPSAFQYESAGLGSPWAQKPLQVVRGENPAVAVMQDGRVLVAGGATVPDGLNMTLDTAEIYDRGSDTVMPAA